MATTLAFSPFRYPLSLGFCFPSSNLCVPFEKSKEFVLFFNSVLVLLFVLAAILLRNLLCLQSCFMLCSVSSAMWTLLFMFFSQSNLVG